MKTKNNKSADGEPSLAPKDAVAFLRLPVPVNDLASFAATIGNIHGAGIVMRENPTGWLEFRRKEKKK